MIAACVAQCATRDFSSDFAFAKFAGPYVSHGSWPVALGLPALQATLGPAPPTLMRRTWW